MGTKPVNETVKECHTPVHRNCSGDSQTRGDDRNCITSYQTHCTTKEVEVAPGKYVRDTQCDKEPVEMCGHQCEVEEDSEECHETVITTTVEVPEEVCNITPLSLCRHATKLIPTLKPTQECTTVTDKKCKLKFSSRRSPPVHLVTRWCQEGRDINQGEDIRNINQGEDIRNSTAQFYLVEMFIT